MLKQKTRAEDANLRVRYVESKDAPLNNEDDVGRKWRYVPPEEGYELPVNNRVRYISPEERFAQKEAIRKEMEAAEEKRHKKRKGMRR